MRLLAVATLLAACAFPQKPPPRPPDLDQTRVADPINKRDLPTLHKVVEMTLRELVAALPEDRRRAVDGVKLEISDLAGDVNAFAVCGGNGPVVGISDGLIRIAARLASSKAIDEILETDTTREEMRTITEEEHPHANPYDLDRDKLSRQHALFVEQIGFALGHELAHHYLGHLRCLGGGEVDIGLGELLPVFDQAKELDADREGVRNVLRVRRDRHGYRWREDGAILVLQMVKAQRELSLREIVLSFEATHPLPEIRLPVITTTAEIWLSTNGAL